MKRLHAIEDAIINHVQEAYLWLWDRTGVYVGTLMFAAYVGDHVCWNPLTWVDFAFIGFAGLWAGIRYVAQSQDLRWFNASQRAWKDFSPRPFFSVLVAAFLLADILQLNAWHLASDTMTMLWNYIGCVQVRDREPKEFFPSLKLARAGA